MMERRKIMLQPHEMRDHIDQFIAHLRSEGLSEDEIERRLSVHYTDTMIRKYTNDEQDQMWAELYEIAMSPGGIGWLIQNMDYMPEFEHRRFACLQTQEQMENRKIYKETPPNTLDHEA